MCSGKGWRQCCLSSSATTTSEAFPSNEFPAVNALLAGAEHKDHAWKEAVERLKTEGPEGNVEVNSAEVGQMAAILKPGFLHMTDVEMKELKQHSVLSAMNPVLLKYNLKDDVEVRIHFVYVSVVFELRVHVWHALTLNICV
jgi:hypothetical protein